ncbi:RHS repeat domain-containing protein [Snodgrassella communis]|uniref:RHS repeat domain-containing protein n=1 Tax=Snodgrassella communis TaxID=2946699 RepID=UPI002351C662|nr:RHS repeat-associated core domain-containing protein [Snodgrassella communis]
MNSDAFGNSELDANNQITMNLRFPGQYYDTETGLSYNYFRDYDAKTGRYIQSDPIGIRGGVNTYVYAKNQPLKLIDPKGKNPLAGAVSGGAVSGGAVGGPPGALVGAIVGTVLGIGMGAYWMAKSAESERENAEQRVDTNVECKVEKKCPPCRTISGKIIPAGTISYRLDLVPPSKPHYPFKGDHYHLFKANQNPNCKCFWNKYKDIDAAGGLPPPPGSILFEEMAN